MKKKRYIEIVLVILMLFNILPRYSYATETEDIQNDPEVSQTETVDSTESDNNTIDDQTLNIEDAQTEIQNTEQSAIDNSPTQQDPIENTVEDDEDIIPVEDIIVDSTNTVEENFTNETDDLQARIDALPDEVEWNILCESQNDEYDAVCIEIELLIEEILETYGLDLNSEDFNPMEDYSYLCPLNLSKIIAIMYPSAMELQSNVYQVVRLVDDSFEKMCQDIFGAGYQDISNDSSYAEVYVGLNSGGEQTGVVGTPEKPYGSLNAAYNGVAGKSGVIIHLMESYKDVQDEITSWPEVDVPAIIISDSYDIAYLNMSSYSWSFVSNTGFYNIKVKLTYDNSINSTMYANGNTIVFGGYQKNNFSFINDSNNRYYPTLFGASGIGSGTSSNHSQVENTSLKIYGGTWSQIFGGGEINSDITGTASLIIDGSYFSEDNQIQSGAVAFDNTHLAYMEGSSNIYGGGAGEFTKLSSESHSNVNNSIVKLSYITTDKYVTPCGGWMGESAEIILDHVSAKGVNARSEGQAANRVVLTIKNSTIKDKVGSLGSNQGDVNKKYISSRTISDFNITIENSSVQRVAVKSGDLSESMYDNYVTGVDLIIKNSTVSSLAMAELPANYTGGTVNLIHLENSQIDTINCGANFAEIKEIVFKQFGTKEKPFVWSTYKFGGHYNTSNSVSEKLVIEDSYVDFKIPYKTDDLSILENSEVKLDSNLTLTIGSYEGNSSSKLVMLDGSSMKISGLVSGTGTVVDPILTTENSKVQIVWKRTVDAAGLDFFTKAEDNTSNEKKNYVPTLYTCQWDNYEVENKEYIYVDGQNGHDNFADYADSECTEDILGRNPNYPVKTLGKAYELCQNENERIVICGPYEISVTEFDECNLIDTSQAKDFNVTITSADNIFDYSDQAYIKFTGTGQSGRADIKEPLTFDNITLITDLPSNSNMRIFSNGYKTVYGSGVTAIKPNGGRFELYGGAYNSGVASTDLTVKAIDINLISAGGYGNNSFVGDNSDTSVNPNVVAKLDVNITKTYSNILEVTFSGDAYGSVEQTLNFDKDTLRNLYLYLSPNYKTIYGDFITHVSGDKSNGYKYAYITPAGQTVKGTVDFQDDSSQYGYLDLREGTYNKVNIEVGSAIGYSNLFTAGTNAKDVSWKLSGDVSAVYGNNNNTYLANGTMKLNVELDSTGNTIIKAGNRDDTDPTVTGYSQNSNVAVTLKNFDASKNISILQGFGSVTFDNSQCAVSNDIYTKNLSVVNNSNINFMKPVTVGQETNPGQLSLLQSGCMIVNDSLSVWGNMIGEESKDQAGCLENNWANDLDETELITVNGSTTGYVYYTTSYDSASIKVTENTKGNEYIVPVAEEGVPPMTINCKPDESEGEQPNRTWHITNPISKKVIFVDGTVNTDDPSYTAHDGSSPSLAFATLEEGYNEVLNGGTIVICGNTEISTWPSNPKAVNITSKVTIGTGENATTYNYFTGETPAYFTITNNVELKNDTTFEYLNINNSSVITIGGAGNKLIMGHLGEDDSLIMTNQKINVGGGTNTTRITSGIDTDVTIYAGTYGIASGTNSSGNVSNETFYKSVKLKIYGGVFDNIYIKGNLYDIFNSLTSDPELWVENAEVKTSIHAAECNYSVGSKVYKITIGKNMVFSDDAKIVTGTNRANYATSMSVELNVDGSGGELYKIPVISTGKSQNSADIRQSSSIISIKNASVGKFYGGLGSNSSLTASEITTELSLYENVTIDNLYFGGANNPGKSTIVNVYSNTVVISSMSAGSENYINNIPITAELNLIGLGDYKLQSGVSLNGLSKVIVTDSNVDITDTGPNITVGTLDASKGNITYLKSILNFEGDYIGGTVDSPTVFYGCKAPNYTINGTVSGITQIRSVDPDPSSNGEVTGKFYYGIIVKATHNDSHSNNNFQCLQNNTNGDLVFSNMDFQLCDSENMDQWLKTDEEDNTNRIQIFVSEEEGSDSNTGTYVSPVKTIKQAYIYANELYTADQEKTKLDIVLLDDVTFDGNMPTNLSSGYMVTIKSGNTISKLILNKAFNVPVDTTFDNICIESTLPTNSVEIFANGHNLVCTDKLNVKAVKGHYPILYGGNSDNTNLDATHMEVYGGTWTQIFGGSKISKVNTSNLVLGEKADTLNIGTVDENSTGVFGGGFNGETVSVSITVNGGSYYRIFGGGMNSSAITGNITIDYNHGTVSRLYGGGQYADTQEDILVNIGTNEGGTPAVITGVYRGSGLYAGLASGKKAVTNVYNNTEISETAQFAAGGYSGNLDITELYIYGGKINCNVYAGGWGEGTEGTYGTVRSSSTVKVQGGTIAGNIYGGGNLAVVNNDSKTAVSSVKILGGTITGNIYGGGNAAGVNNSKVEISSDIVGDIFGGSQNIISDTLQVQKTSKVILNTCDINGSVFGGSDTSGLISDSVDVIIQGNMIISGENNGIYGGGSKALLKTTPVVAVLSDTQVKGNIYGGGKGEVDGLLGRASNLLASLFSTDVTYNISGLTDANVPSTNITIKGKVVGNVYGGGEMATVGNSDSNTWNNQVTNVTLYDGSVVTGNIYGGGKGESGKDYAVVYGCTNVILNGGTVKTEEDAESNKFEGAIFGGGEIAPVSGDTNITVNNGYFSNIFGGNDINGEVNGKAIVTIPSTSNATVKHVYGGGRDAAHNNNINELTISGGTVSEAYGGGYGNGATSSETHVIVDGGSVDTVYGGGNAASTVKATTEINGGNITTVYGGGNAATVTETTEIIVNCNDDIQHVDTLFAGNDAATMYIQPTLTLTDGVIGTLYGGGNAGVMEVQNGLSYEFDYPNIQISNVYAGCNNTIDSNGNQLKTANVSLKLKSGTYETVYGGNNANGYMDNTNIIIEEDLADTLSVDTVYGGGNLADSNNTKVELKSGKVATIYGGGNLASANKTTISLQGGEAKTVYGGGNAATVTGEVLIEAPVTSGGASITDLYCGNNAADMNIAPNVNLDSIKISNFYGGGNAGKMTSELVYTLSSVNTNIGTLYGGCNKADATGKVTLNLSGSIIDTVYGGCNTEGNIPETIINVTGGKLGTVFGGGQGENTTVTTTNLNLKNGIVEGNVYGGSGYGKVVTSNVTAREDTNTDVLKVYNNIYGAGYGQSSSVMESNVTIDLKLNISEIEDSLADVVVTEIVKSSDSTSGESTATAQWKKNWKDISYIGGDVFGGGDMGQVGVGYINNSTNTAVIEDGGMTNVSIVSGYINGNVFGGGNGQPSESLAYSTYMGAVFGTSNVTVTGGYINNNLFGCGQQSRSYADSANGNKASVVNVTDQGKPILIGKSIFGGGNKGNGNVQNASVATVYGDTYVNITGNKDEYTQIYLLSHENRGGGVYGDGNLCLVSGKKYVTLKYFSCGRDRSKLKTFYSLQRADEVNMIGSSIVLNGAVDLVSENTDDTLYSINRVGILNLKESSTIKLVETVNLLSEMTSDQDTNRQFINRGNNSGNVYVNNGYVNNGGSAPEAPLSEQEAKDYINAYENYYGNGSGSINSNNGLSINVVCVANGGYLEIKKNAHEYGPITGLYTLQLLNATPGEGGGFVYASIDGKKVADDKYITGNFVCVTKQNNADDNYMIAYHDVGGAVIDGKYEYYLWYLKGNKYNYNVDITSYIGTSDVEFENTISLPVENSKKELVLATIKNTASINGIELSEVWANTWDDSKTASDNIALKLELITSTRNGSSVTIDTEVIGYIGFETVDDNDPSSQIKNSSSPVWGIWKDNKDGTYTFIRSNNDTNTIAYNADEVLGNIGNNVVGLQLKYTMYKGSSMVTEFKNLPFEMMLLEVTDQSKDSNGNITVDSCIKLINKINLSAIRIVPTQAAYISSGRLFGGIPSSTNINITKTSAFTVQFITKYIPSAFNTGSENKVIETIQTKYKDIYLVDENGVGYTIEENANGSITILNKTNVNNPDVANYNVTKEDNGTYKVTYTMNDVDAPEEQYDCTATVIEDGFIIPKGTVITLLASIDERTPTYWYYYCEEEKESITLADFKKMNVSKDDVSSENVYSTIYSTESSRITENMIFVFDFSNVTATEWQGINLNSNSIILKHTYDNKYDIMDYVSTIKGENGENTYIHETPKESDKFTFSESSDGISSFTVSNTSGADDPEYYQNDVMNFTLNIEPDTSTTNTRYEEREYAVIIKLKDSNGQEIPFPEGTTLSYNGKKIAAESENKYFIVPVVTVGKHQVTLASELSGFEAGSYTLSGELYSTSATGYYNSISVTHTSDSVNAGFIIIKNPDYSLSIEESSNNHLVRQGGKLQYSIKTQKDGLDIVASSADISVKLYRYEEGTYTKVSNLDTVLNVDAGLPNMYTVAQNAAAGTYRLEFKFHDCTEYWDFIVLH